MPIQSIVCPSCTVPMLAETTVCPACGADVNDVPTATALHGSAANRAPTLAGNSPAAADAFPDGLRPPERPDEVGRLGGYRVLGRLGAGGMGAVYKAEDPQLRRHVALKVMLPKFAADPTSKERFLREARAAAAVEHDHIIPIHQVGEDHGTAFLAMPMLKGETLADRLKGEGPLPIAEALRVGREIALGLAAAHAGGLIHRDIKPANVWLEGAARRVKILDFGLARSVAPQAADDQLTDPGAVVGTPAYMSPEQARNEALDARSDLFSLGTVLYQLTTGRLPFAGTTTMAVLTSLAVGRPRPPRAVNPDVPPAVSDYILRLLRPDPGARPGTAEEVAGDLARLLVAATVGPLDARPPGDPWEAIGDTVPLDAPTPTPRPVRRKSPALLWAGLGVLVLIGAVVLASLVITIKTPKGTLVIETDDPDVEVVVKKNGAVLIDRTKNREIELAVGEYGIELAEKKDGLSLTTNKFELRKNGKATVRVKLEKKQVVAAKPKEKEKADPAEPGPPGPVPELKPLVNVQLPAAGQCLALSPTGGPAAVGAADGVLYLIDPADGTIVRKLTGHESRLVSVAYSPDGKTLASGSDDNTVRLWDPATGTPGHVFQTKFASWGVAFSADNRLVAGASGNTVWDVRTGKPGVAFDCEYFGATLVFVPGEAELIATDFETGTVRRWDTATGKLIKEIADLGPGTRGVALSPGADRVVVSYGHSDNNGRVPLPGVEFGIKVLDRKTGALVTDLRGHTWVPYAVAAHPTRELLVSGGFDGTVRVWDLKAGRPLGKAESPTDNVWGVAISADGRRVCSTGVDQSFRVWELPAADPDRAAAAWVLAAGGAVVLEGEPAEYRAGTPLPKGPFRVKLVDLDGAAAGVTDAGLGVFRGCPNITGLNLAGLRLGAAGLAHFKDCRALTSLNLHEAVVTDDGLAAFADRTTLTFLSLHKTAATDAGLAHFKRCRKLTELHLGDTGVTDAGLADFGGCPDLEQLGLAGTKVTDTGVAHFKGCTTLKAVWLPRTGVTDDTVAVLAGLPNLTDVDLAATKVTAAGVARLKKALPACKVVWEPGE